VGRKNPDLTHQQLIDIRPLAAIDAQFVNAGFKAPPKFMRGEGFERSERLIFLIGALRSPPCFASAAPHSAPPCVG
jgi:hypothetical protein